MCDDARHKKFNGNFPEPARLKLLSFHLLIKLGAKAMAVLPKKPPRLLDISPAEVFHRGLTIMSSEREGAGDVHVMHIEIIDGLYSYALTLTRNHAAAEDLVQETYLRAIPAVGRLRPDSNMKAWLFTILRNVWFNQLRRWRTAPVIVELGSDGIGQIRVADTAKDPHATYVSTIEREQVRTAIQQLSIEHREIIMLREYEELSYREIATILECPLGTVMSRLASARSKLRDLLSLTSVAPRSTKRVAIGKEAIGT
jgi:RNA polymerase sigma-70 factor (ECF subfamily)